MIVRDENGNVVDISLISTTQLYQHHVEATNRIKRATVSIAKTKPSDRFAILIFLSLFSPSPTKVAARSK
jgi:hypothetical protein